MTSLSLHTSLKAVVVRDLQAAGSRIASFLVRPMPAKTLNVDTELAGTRRNVLLRGSRARTWDKSAVVLDTIALRNLMKKKATRSANAPWNTALSRPSVPATGSEEDTRSLQR